MKAKAVRIEPFNDGSASPLNVDGELHPTGTVIIHSLPGHLQLFTIPQDQITV